MGVEEYYVTPEPCYCLSCRAERDSETPPQIPKDAPRSFYLSEEDIDLIQNRMEAWMCDHDRQAHRDEREVLKKLGRVSDL
jgi:hypothetical protein